MGHTFCPECGKKYTLRDDIVGKKVKCKCGAQFRMPSSASSPAATPSLSLSCPHCQHEIQPNWIACPECGERLPADNPQTPSSGQPSPRPATTAIRTSDNSVVKAVVNPPPGAQLAPGLLQAAQERQPIPPMIRAGSESVVRAEINASHTVSAAGDIVTHKEVHSTHHETHIHARESAVGTVLKGLKNAFYPHKEEVERIYKECQEASNSDAALLAFVAKHISAIEAVAIMDAGIQRPLTQARYSAVMHALEIIEQRNAGRPEALAQVARSREKIAKIMSAQKLRPFLIFGAVFAFLGLMALMLMAFASSGLGHDSEVRQEVQELIREGKYGEARIRAQDLSGSFHVKRMVDAIDKAETSQNAPGQ